MGAADSMSRRTMGLITAIDLASRTDVELAVLFHMVL
jgi:ethanolamine utilization protein EutP (predicted NTPase)